MPTARLNDTAKPRTTDRSRDAHTSGQSCRAASHPFRRGKRRISTQVLAAKLRGVASGVAPQPSGDAVVERGGATVGAQLTCAPTEGRHTLTETCGSLIQTTVPLAPPIHAPAYSCPPPKRPRVISSSPGTTQLSSPGRTLAGFSQRCHVALTFMSGRAGARCPPRSPHHPPGTQSAATA